MFLLPFFLFFFYLINYHWLIGLVVHLFYGLCGTRLCYLPSQEIKKLKGKKKKSYKGKYKRLLVTGQWVIALTL